MMSPESPRKSELSKGEGMQQKQKKPSIRKGPYRGDVSALCLVSSPQRRLLLAGTGAQVLLYDLVTGDLLCSRNVFDGVRVHGIYSGPGYGRGVDFPASEFAFKMSTIVIHGERRIKIFKLMCHLEEETPQLQSVGSLPRFSHWIMDVRILKEEEAISKSAITADVKDLRLLAVGLSNNTICIWDLLNSAIIYHVECSERCLLYSMTLWGDSLETLRAGAGTIFNEIVVWKLGSNLSPVGTLSKILTELKNSGNSREHKNGESLEHDVVGDTSSQFVVLQRILGHEGSIHRLTWSLDGLSLVSVSDDRSARVWCANKSATGDDSWLEGVVAGPVLYGHGSRLWDCYVGEQLLITASEDCTCRVWTAADGKHLATLKGHIGRGIWRCVYDPELNSLITAGADSSIKVQSLDKWVPRASSCERNQEVDSSIQKFEPQSFSIIPPWLNGATDEPSGFMNSKSEYVRCVALSSPRSLYVSTNQGCLYNVDFERSKETSWTLVQDVLEGPIVCMDVLTQSVVKDDSSESEDFPTVDTVVVGTGKGLVSVMQVRRSAEQWRREWQYTWAAGKERQLLGVYFCKSLGGMYIFTTDPRGTWRMWHVARKFRDERSKENRPFVSNCSNPANSDNDVEESAKYTAELIAFGRGSHARVLCIDVCPEMQLLVCGDKGGDLSAFLLPKDTCRRTLDDEKVVMDTATEIDLQVPVVAVFKGAHGISAIASVSVLPFTHGQQAEIISTGRDGCICRFLLDQHLTAPMTQASPHLACTGIEKVAALSIVESLEHCKGMTSQKHLVRPRIAAGFAGSDFLLWDLTNQCEPKFRNACLNQMNRYAKDSRGEGINVINLARDEIGRMDVEVCTRQVMRVVCGGWRRPHSVIIGGHPELQYCFVFVKDQVVQIWRSWGFSIGSGGVSPRVRSSFYVTTRKKSIQSLRGQFHGKETSSVLFLHSANYSLGHEWSNPISWIASGSEDGTVLFSRYTEDTGEQLDPTAVLGEHVGGSAVRALALVAEAHLISADDFKSSAERKTPVLYNILGSAGESGLLFSAGAKEVLTCWLLHWLPEVKGDELSTDFGGSVAEISASSVQNRAPSPQWLSTHIPERTHPSATEEKETASAGDIDDKQEFLSTEKNAEHKKEAKPSTSVPEDAADDQRYLALTAFGTRCTKTGDLVSFIAAASSNATLHLFAFYVTHRSWIELAVLEYETAIVLAIEHFIVPLSSHNSGERDVYIILTGAANGNITLWDVTNLVDEYSNFNGLIISSAHVAPLRPLTGRGSQGGRRRKKIGENLSSASHSLNRTESDALGPLVVPEGENDTLDEENPPLSLLLDANRLPVGIKRPPLRLHPFQELIAVHQSGINCMTVGRIERVQNSASSKTVYIVISGGDDQALHIAAFTVSMDNSAAFKSAQRPDGGESSTSSLTPSVSLQCFSQSSVPCAHNSSVKGVWTDGLWVFSTGLDQRLRCWRIDADAACSKTRSSSCEGNESSYPMPPSLVESVTCVIDVPEPASLHVQHCRGGLYRIAVVGRGLQVIKFDSSSLSCQQLEN